jgi:hypothetical protein
VTNDDLRLRKALVRLAHDKRELRADILDMIKTQIPKVQVSPSYPIGQWYESRKHPGEWVAEVHWSKGGKVERAFFSNEREAALWVKEHQRTTPDLTILPPGSPARGPRQWQ